MEHKVEKTASAGNKGKGIRSDCFVSIELRQESGLIVNLQSKVDVMYGNSIHELALEILHHFGIQPRLNSGYHNQLNENKLSDILDFKGIEYPNSDSQTLLMNSMAEVLSSSRTARPSWSGTAQKLAFMNTPSTKILDSNCCKYI